MKFGYAEDFSGATHKYVLIEQINETTWKGQSFYMMQRLNGTEYACYGKLRTISNVHKIEENNGS